MTATPRRSVRPEPPVALVAGASRGLGYRIARELAARGLRVHGCARTADALDRAAGEVGLVPRVVDVRDAEQVGAWVESVRAETGRIDVAIHVAGVIQVGPVEATTLGHFRDAVDTMLWGPVHLALAVLPGMLEADRGRIGVVTSIGGVVSVPHLLPYSVAKFGAVGLAEGLAAELAGTGVTATTVVPGLMRTGGHRQARFVGNAEKDYAWFATGASAPVVSINADRAARRIVTGVLAGRRQVELTPLAMLGRRVHGVAPATTTRLLGLVHRFLPPVVRVGPLMSDAAPSVPGYEVRDRLRSPMLNRLSTLGERAADAANEGHPPA